MIELLRASVIGYDAPYEGHYSESNAIGHSDLRKIASCPSRWFKQVKSDEVSNSMAWGSLVDSLLFGVGFDRFETRPDTYSRFNEKTKQMDVKPWNAIATECKEWLAENDGKQVISKQFKSDAIHAVNLLKADKDVFELLNGARFQCWLEGVFLCTETDIEIKVRGLVDIVPDGQRAYSAFLADLKTTTDGGMAKWWRKCEDGWYHVQGAIYIDLWNMAMQENRNRFLHVIQENEYPYEIAHRELSEQALRLGRSQYKAALQTLARCKKTGIYEGLDSGNGGWDIVEPDAYAILRSGVQIEDAPMPDWGNQRNRQNNNGVKKGQ